MNLAYLIIGGNLGDRSKNFSTARSLIQQQAGEIILASHLYETEPWGIKEQPQYRNQALEIATKFDAPTLMEVLLDIEKTMGRVRTKKYDARIIDIDILFFGKEIHHSENLVIPHPRMQERRFVLEPLAEIAPGFIHPVFGKTIRQLLVACTDESKVVKLDIPEYRF